MAAVWILSPLAGRLGLLDRPDGALKDHVSDTPIVGGIAVFLGLHATMAFGQTLDTWLLGITFVLLVVGVVDDIVGLSPLIRLIAAAFAGLGLVWAVDAQVHLLAAISIVVLMVIAVNAVNLLDGADGIAGSAAFVSAVGIGLLAVEEGTAAVLPPLILAGAIVGFLVFNWPPARVFLGDGGAYVVAGSLAFFAVTLTNEPANVSSDWFPTSIVAASTLGVFLVDLIVTLLRRIVSRAPLFGGDRSHVYDQLSLEGHSPLAVVGMVAGVQTVIVALVVTFYFLFHPWVAAGLSVFVVLVTIGVLLAMGFSSRRGSSLPPESLHLSIGE
jgi:UDP-GlcNAc:undecaprenyl-phosphate/decaprenyl-phosphate GlcNAc-1-phosphate transferase